MHFADQQIPDDSCSSSIFQSNHSIPRFLSNATDDYTSPNDQKYNNIPLYSQYTNNNNNNNNNWDLQPSHYQLIPEIYNEGDDLFKQESYKRLQNGNQSSQSLSTCYDNDSNKNMKFMSLSIAKRPKKKFQKKAEITSLYKNVACNETIHPSQGLEITNEGVFRFSYILNQLSFGNQYIQPLNICFNKLNQIAEVDVTHYNYQLPVVTYDQAMQFVMRSPCKYYLQANAALQEFYKKKHQMDNLIKSIELDSILKDGMDDKMKKHVESCKEYLSNYAKQHEGSIYQYTIGRFNYERGYLMITKRGYSKSFLDLVGINLECFSQLIFRNKRVDLIKDQDEIMLSSLFGILAKQNQQNNTEYCCTITTLDGFELKLEVSQKFVRPDYEARQFSCLRNEYIFQLTEYEVSLDDLQNLIKYRENLMYNKKIMNFDALIRKELSYLFDDFEYSSQSKQFLEKYYQDNIDYLLLLQSQRQIQLQQQLQM